MQTSVRPYIRLGDTLAILTILISWLPTDVAPPVLQSLARMKSSSATWHMGRRYVSVNR